MGITNMAESISGVPLSTRVVTGLTPGLHSPVPVSPANSAPTTSVGAQQQIVPRKGVTMDTVGLGHVDGGERYSTGHILPTSDRLKMSGLDTPLVSAQVIEFQPFRDRPYKSFVYNPMGLFNRATYVKYSVTRSHTESGLPLPATITKLNFNVDSVGQVSLAFHTTKVTTYGR